VTWNRAQIAYFAGLVASVCTALVGQGEIINEPYRHYVTIAGVIGTAVAGFLMQPPRGDAQTRIGDPLQEKQ
jgi:hypothetical protein